MPSTTDSDTGLKRVLTAVDAGWIVAGSMIGSGIFITPGFVAKRLAAGPGWILAAWLSGGLVVLCGAAVYAELGARIPRAGGDYRYLARAYGPLWGFMNGWAAITLTFSAAAAAQTRSALAYLSGAVPGMEGFPAFVTIGTPLVILFLTWANTAGARVAGKTTAVLTALPLLLLLALFLFGTTKGEGALEWPAAATSPTPETFWGFGLGLAMIPIFFTYSGWNAAAYLAGEMKNPGRSLARGLLVGTASVTAIYLVINTGLLLTLSLEELAGSHRPAADAARVLLGEGGERALSLVIAVAILGSANVTLMAGARVYYAMATDRLAPRAIAGTNRSGVPSIALWAGGVWAAVLGLFGDVEGLVGWATLGILILSSLTVTSLFVLRRRGVGAPQFRCPGYPVTPALYLMATLGAAVSSYFYNPRHALIGLGILALGFPAYFLTRRLLGPAS